MGKLIDLRQIKHGVAIKTDVDALKASYDAYKVLTDIAGGAAGNYNVNELLTSLKNTVDLQLGDGAGSVEQRIQAAKDDLQGKIDVINNTVIRDRVKLHGTISAAGVLSFDLGGKLLSELVPEIDSTQTYPVYHLNNRPVLDANGEVVVYDFTTQTLSGVPHKANPDDAELPTEYIPINAPVDFKVFPVGSFTFASLPEDYLLDNIELNLVYYAKAIDDIVVGLAGNSQLIDHVKALVGTETVQQQITLITNALQARIETLEDRADVVDDRLAVVQGDATTVGSIAQQVKTASDALQAQLTTLQGGDDVNGSVARAVKLASDALQAQIDVINGDELTNGSIAKAVNDAKVLLQQSIAALTATVEDNRKAAYNANQDRQYDIALINAVVDVRDVPVVSSNQVDFSLSEVPNATLVVMKINGISYTEGEDFTVNRPAKTLAWTNTDANGGFDILNTMKIEILYKKTNAVASPVYQ